MAPDIHWTGSGAVPHRAALAGRFRVSLGKQPGCVMLQKKRHAASTAWPRTEEVDRHSQGPGKSPCSQQVPARVAWTSHPSWLKRNKEAEEKMGIGCVHVCSSTAVSRVEWRRLVQDKVGVVWVCETKEKAVLRIQGGDFYS